MGLSKYGPAKKNKINEGDDINIKFNGDLDQNKNLLKKFILNQLKILVEELFH